MIYIAILFFLLGLIWGSFLNALIYRLYNNLTLWGRSFCPECKKVLRVLDLVPVLSFLFLAGRCRQCHKKISGQYPLVELLTGFLFAFAWWQTQDLNLLLFRNLYFILVLIFIMVFDWKYYLILDKIIWPAFVIGLLVNLLLGLAWQSFVFGILFGAIFFGAQYYLSGGKWIGDGDVKLGILLGAMFGWPMIILVIAISYLIGGVTAVVLLLTKRKKRGDILPLGAFLAAAAIIVLLWGKQILMHIFAF